MTREELKTLGLTDEQVESVMKSYGKGVVELNNKLTAANQEKEALQNQLTLNKAEIDKLKDGDTAKNKELSDQLIALQAKFDTIEKESKEQLAEQQKDFAIKLALKDANAYDDDIVLSQLDKSTIKLTDGNLKGLKEQLDALKESKSFLFNQKTEAPQSPKIVSAGNPTGGSEEKTLTQKIQERLGK